jgi:hypothetical protein
MMKKLLSICLAALMILSLGSAVFAAEAFISSPVKPGAPELVGAENESEDCEAVLSITAYADREILSDEVIAKFEYAYGVLRGQTEDPGFAALLAQIAAERGIEVSDLVASDFFDISSTDCEGHEDHGHFDITLKAEALNNFVCLLHYYNGTWRVVDNAKVTQGGTHLEFTEEEFSPFVIIVDTSETPVEPPVDDKMTVGEGILLGVGIAAGVAGLGALGYFVILPWWKKRKYDQMI